MGAAAVTQASHTHTCVCVCSHLTPPTYCWWLEQACRRLGITCPILPGHMIIQNYKGFKKFTGWCKTGVPARVAADLEKIKDDDAAVKKYGVQVATDTCKKLLANGTQVLCLCMYDVCMMYVCV